MRRPYVNVTLPVPIALLAAIAFVLVASFVLVAPGARASLSGLADVTAVQARIDGVRRNTVRQQYDARLSIPLTPYVDLRASIRYYNFDLAIPAGTGSWEEEIQPTGELIWRHPEFVVTASTFHRTSRARPVGTELITDSFVFNASTQNRRYPILSLRYDWQKIEEKSDVLDQEIRDRRGQVGLDYILGLQNLMYRLSLRDNRNIVSGLATERLDHLFRWSGSSGVGGVGRLRLSGNYTYNHTTQIDELTGDGVALEAIPVAAGLFAIDDSPEIGQLDPVPGLIDGNTSAPTVPAIGIGGGLTGRNIGIDFGIVRAVSALYVYTDRLSSPEPRWAIYTSADNLTWSLWIATAEARYNNGLQRYELLFPEVAARYVKTVKDGINDVAQVLVTEIQAFRGIDTEPGEERKAVSHRADARLAYQLSPLVSGALDVAYQAENSPRIFGDRKNLDYVLSARLGHSRAVSHNLRWEQSFQTFAGDREELRDDSAAYTFLVEPLETLGGALSLNARRTFLDNIKDQRFLSGSAELYGRPLRKMRLSLNVGRTINELLTSDTRLDVWTYRVSTDATMTRALNLILNYTHQRTEIDPGDEVRLRDLIGFGFNLRLGTAVFARGSINVINDFRNSAIQDYLLSWNLSRKLTLIGQSIINIAEGFDSRRGSISLNYFMSRRSLLYVRYSDIDLSRAGGGRTTQFQQGIRIAL